MGSCKTCLWDYDGQCVSENLNEISEDASFMSCNCVGWVRKDFEEHFNNTYMEVLLLLQRRNCAEMENILKYIKNQRGESDDN